MFIKIVPALLLIFGFTAGCAKENVKPAQPVQVMLKDGGDCLGNFGLNVEKYKRGELSDTQVGQFWSCVQKSVGDYQRLTSGDQAEGGYTPQALRRFLQKYFFKSGGISDDLLAALMELKRVALSGENSSISRNELAVMQEFLQLLKEITIELNPHVDVLFLNSSKAADEEIETAGAVAERSFAKLGSWLETNGQAYTFTQLRELARALEKNEDGAAAKFLKVLPAAKQILLSGSNAQIGGREWRVLTAALGQGYRSFLSVHYAFKDDLNTALSRDVLPAGFEHALGILERSARAHDGKEIPLSEWRELFVRAEEAGFLTGKFATDNLMHTLGWVLDRVAAKGLGKPACAVTLDHLAYLKTVFADWRSLREVALNKKIAAGPVQERFEHTLAAGPAQEWDERGRMAFPQNPAASWTTVGRLHMVWPFVVMNLLKDAFVPGGEAEVNDKVMEAAGLEILTTMRKFGWLTETKDTIGKKLLREGDLFTLASNGNGTIDLFEASRYLAFIASSFRAAQIWMTEAESACAGFDAVCMREIGGDLSRDILAPLPRLQNWLSQKDAVPRFVAYFKAGEETILEKVTQGEFGTADVLQVWMLFQYVETFLLRYDRDFTDTVSLPEATPAFTVYGPILGKMLSSVGLPPEELFGFFTFMMKYGDTPFTMFGGQILYNHWKWHQNDWVFESERTHLMGILNQLSKL